MTESLPCHRLGCKATSLIESIYPVIPALDTLMLTCGLCSETLKLSLFFCLLRSQVVTVHNEFCLFRHSVICHAERFLENQRIGKAWAFGTKYKTVQRVGYTKQYSIFSNHVLEIFWMTLFGKGVNLQTQFTLFHLKTRISQNLGILVNGFTHYNFQL